MARLRGVLSLAEQARADRFVRSSDRERWIVSRAGLRFLLGRKLDAGPTEIAFTEEANGRPALAGANNLSFNLSHSANVAALAMSSDVRVGVDVEEVRPITDDEIAWALSSAERIELSEGDPAERLERFFKFWTLKEALMKGTGLGAQLPLQDFDMGLNPPRLARFKDESEAPGQWNFHDIAPQPGMCGAVAARTEGRVLVASWTWVEIG
ncbi:MAG TPA: 4'-phosphopantetheinyl transferase superfamily protein [Hyphomonadaceae bacterium]|nr:4'-phosphopantetheinyl transferase superfamily protein [Hyphomonadaceae bacterium]HPN06460.1 4'-phosphopantetheinyl transferase superfamily protein [Hyphomonadaceae bacterium]